MVDALIALVIALLLLFVFPMGWTGRVTALGGLAFFIYVLILCLRWLFGRLKK